MRYDVDAMVILLLGFQLLQSLLEATSMRLLGHGQSIEPCGYLVEALALCRSSHTRIHIGVFLRIIQQQQQPNQHHHQHYPNHHDWTYMGLTDNGRLEVLDGGADRLTSSRVSNLLEERQMLQSMASLTFQSVRSELDPPT
jgi:hypothetical protein